MRIITVANQKGGVGKTTTVFNLGAGLARQGKKVLLVDLDPQSNLTEAAIGEEPDKSIYNVLCGDASMADVARVDVRENLALIPSNIDMSTADIELAGRAGFERKLKKALHAWPAFSGFDFVVIDTPPNLGVLTLNALVASKELIIPVQVQHFARKALVKIMDTVANLKEEVEHELDSCSILFTMVDRRTTLSRNTMREVVKDYPGITLESVIRYNTTVAESPAHGKAIYEHQSMSHGAEDYARLVKEIMTDQEN